MAPKRGISFTFSKRLLWRVSIGVSVLATILLGVLVWMSGASETRDAFSTGRRLLMQLDTGEIKGYQVTVAAPEPKELPPSVADAGEQDGDAADAAPRAPATPLPDIDQALMEKTDAGILPKIGADSTKPWKQYAKPYDRKGSLPMIAIVVSGMGQARGVTDSAMRLPESVALSFNPYAKDVSSWITSARRNGHEVYVDLPLEPANYPAADAGPYSLMTALTPEANEARLQWLMARGQGYVGFLMPQNDGFSSKNDAVKAVLQSMAHRGVALIVGREPAKTDTRQLIDESNVASLTADALIDEELSATAIQTRLASLEQVAKQRGYAIGIAQGYPITIEQLNAWSSRMESRGYVLVPVSFLIKLRFS